MEKELERNRIMIHLEAIVSTDSAKYFLSIVSKYSSYMFSREERERETGR